MYLVMAKQRQIKIEQRGAIADMQALESRTDEELERETKFKSAALAILGARAAERYDHKSARRYFERSLAAAKPQERMQIRRMRDASLALAERRPGDLKEAVQRLGHEGPNRRQLALLRLMSLIVPPPGSSALIKLRSVLLVIVLILLLVLVGFGLIKLIALPLGGLGTGSSILFGALLVVAVLAVLALIGNRRQQKLRAAKNKSS